ncbi:MAG: hypothetical protein ABSF66_03480 [Terriglobales bacterium]|jgi:hypothetical protein
MTLLNPAGSVQGMTTYASGGQQLQPSGPPASYPSQVVSIALTGQSLSLGSALSPLVLWSNVTSPSGKFRVSAVCKMNAPATTGSQLGPLVIVFNDASDGQSVSVPILDQDYFGKLLGAGAGITMNSTSAGLSGSAILQATPNTTVSYYFTYLSNPAGTGLYSLSITVEALE